MNAFLEFDDREKELLRTVLEGRLGELRDQIYKADSSVFRTDLKETERILLGLIEKLSRGSQAQQGEHRVERGPLEKVS